MKEIEDLFKDGDGMTLKESTPEQRKEIWELLFCKNLIFSQEIELNIELEYVERFAFNFSDLDNNFCPCFLGSPENNIPFEEFKNRLLQLND